MINFHVASREKNDHRYRLFDWTNSAEMTQWKYQKKKIFFFQFTHHKIHIQYSTLIHTSPSLYYTLETDFRRVKTKTSIYLIDMNWELMINFYFYNLYTYFGTLYLTIVNAIFPPFALEKPMCIPKYQETNLFYGIF